MAKFKVRYQGIADERLISAKDLKARDISVPEDLVWNRQNLFAVTVDATPELEALLRNEGHFRLETLNDDGSTQVVAEAVEPDKEGDVLVDGDTGAKTEAKARK